MEHLSIYAFLISLVALVVAGKALYDARQPINRFLPSDYRKKLKKAEGQAKKSTQST